MSLPREIPVKALGDEILQLPSHKYKAGKNWNLFETPEPKVYWIKSGIVKVGCFTAEGLEDLRFLVKGQTMIGEMAVLGTANPDDFAVAVTDCEICEIDALTLSKLLAYNDDFQRWLMELMRSRLSFLEKRLQAVLFKPSKDRVLEFLHNFILEFGYLKNGLFEVPSLLSHTDIAQFTSTSRQTVNRVFNQLRKDQTLDYDKEFLWIEEDKVGVLMEV